MTDPAQTRSSRPDREFYSAVAPERYEYDRYLRDIQRILNITSAQMITLGETFRRAPLSHAEWLHFLLRMYPVARDARILAGRAARKLYDYQRDLAVPTVEANGLFDRPDEPELIGPDNRPIRVQDDTNIKLTLHAKFKINDAPSDPEWFEEQMEPLRVRFREGKAKEADVVELAGRVNKFVLDGPRKLTMWAANEDPKIKAWARVEGNENIGSCAFCAMLIARGPVYQVDSFRNAALNLLDNPEKRKTAAKILASTNARTRDEKLNELMTRWHPHCDCQVVPVFDRRRWIGRDQYLAMKDLWESAIRDENGKVIASGRDALNAFRRRLNRGDLPPEIRRPRAA